MSSGINTATNFITSHLKSELFSKEKYRQLTENVSLPHKWLSRHPSVGPAFGAVLYSEVKQYHQLLTFQVFKMPSLKLQWQFEVGGNGLLVNVQAKLYFLASNIRMPFMPTTLLLK